MAKRDHERCEPASKSERPGMDIDILHQQAEVSNARERERNARQYKLAIATAMSVVLDVLRVDIEREEAEARAARHITPRIPTSRYFNPGTHYDAQSSQANEISEFLMSTAAPEVANRLDKALERYQRETGAITQPKVVQDKTMYDSVTNRAIFFITDIVPCTDLATLYQYIKNNLCPFEVTFPLTSPTVTELQVNIFAHQSNTPFSAAPKWSGVTSTRPSFCRRLCKNCCICSTVIILGMAIGIGVINYMFPLPPSITMAYHHA